MWYSENFILDEKDNINLVEYLASYINPEAVEKVKLMKNEAGRISSENPEDILDKKDQVFNDPLIKSIGESLKKKDTNKLDKDITNLDLQSPLHKLIRGIKN